MSGSLTFLEKFHAVGSIGLGLFMLYHLFIAVGFKYLFTYANLCLALSSDETQVPFYLRTGINIVDSNLCIFTKLFADAKDPRIGPKGIFWTRALVLNAYAFWLVSAIESTRKSSKWFYKWYSVQAYLSQFVGISIVEPALWLSSFILTGSQRKKVSPLSTSVVWAIHLAFGSLAVVGYKLCEATSSHEFAIYVPFFLLLPLSMPFISSLIGTFFTFCFTAGVNDNASMKRASLSASTLYSIQAIISTIVWLLIVLDFFKSYDPTLNLEKIMTGLTQDMSSFMKDASHFENYAAYFLFADNVIMLYTFTVWAGIDSGFLKGVHVAVSSFVIGPAASLFHFASWREIQFQEKIEKDERKLK